MRNLFVVSCSALLLSGCVSNIGLLGMASTQSELSPNVKYKRLGTCKAVDKLFVFLVPWGETRIEPALKACMEKYPSAAYVSNVRVGIYQNNWIFFAWVGYQVEGTVFGRVEPSKGKAPQSDREEQTYLLEKSQSGLAMFSPNEIIAVVPLTL